MRVCRGVVVARLLVLMFEDSRPIVVAGNSGAPPQQEQTSKRSLGYIHKWEHPPYDNI
jgi:hypothetical protein